MQVFHLYSVTPGKIGQKWILYSFQDVIFKPNVGVKTKKTVKSIAARSRCLGIHIRIGIARFPYDHPPGRFHKQTLGKFLELYR